MTFNRVKWFRETLRLDEVGPAFKIPGSLEKRKDNIAILAAIADEDGVVSVAEFEQSLSLPPGNLRQFGETLQLWQPE